jgi:predicted ester cyclase
MSTAQEAINEAAFRRFHDATNSGELKRIADTVDECVAPDAAIHAPVPLAADGPHVLVEIWAKLLEAYPDVHVTIEDLIAKDDKIVARQSVTATHMGDYLGLAPTGRPVAYDEIFIVRFSEGRIVELWGVVDVFAQLRQLGAVVAPAA